MKGLDLALPSTSSCTELTKGVTNRGHWHLGDSTMHTNAASHSLLRDDHITHDNCLTAGGGAQRSVRHGIVVPVTTQTSLLLVCSLLLKPA